MGFLMIKRLFLLAVCGLILASCNKLRIRDFPEENEPFAQPLLTLQNNFQRNALSAEELAPPLVEEWEESLPSLPSRGFSASGNYLVFGMTNGYLAALDLEDGRFLGKKNLGDACPAPPTIYSSVAFQSFETGKSGLIAYNLQTGVVLWEIRDQFSTSSPVLVDERLFHQTAAGLVFCLKYQDGTMLWQKYTGHAVRNSLAYADDTLISAGSDGTVTAIGHRTGSTVWQNVMKGSLFADPVIADSLVYIADYAGDLTTIQLKTGKIVARTRLETPLYCGPTVDASYIYIGLSDGRFVAMDKTSFKIRYTFKGQGPISSPPLVSDAYIYFTTLANHLYILKKSDGKLLQDIEFDGRARSTPIIKNNILVIASDAKVAYAYVQNF